MEKLKKETFFVMSTDLSWANKRKRGGEKRVG